MRIFKRMCVLGVLAAVVSACSPATRGAHNGAETGPEPIETAAVVTRAEEPAAPDWRPHFSDVSRGAIRVDLTERTLTYWAPGGEEARTFPIAVPRTPEFQRTGRTEIVRRRVGPDWRPTPAMLQRNPSLPTYVGPGPHNPLGEYALYLDWQYYAIHGTNDQRSIGTRASSGCIRLASDDIEWLFSQAGVGTPVLMEGRVTGPRGRLPQTPVPDSMRVTTNEDAAISPAEG